MNVSMDLYTHVQVKYITMMHNNARLCGSYCVSTTRFKAIYSIY